MAFDESILPHACGALSTDTIDTSGAVDDGGGFGHAGKQADAQGTRLVRRDQGRTRSNHSENGDGEVELVDRKGSQQPWACERSANRPTAIRLAPDQSTWSRVSAQRFGWDPAGRYPPKPSQLRCRQPGQYHRSQVILLQIGAPNADCLRVVPCPFDQTLMRRAAWPGSY